MFDSKINNTVSPLDFVALIGAPNSGKTTLYNWLTASQFKTVNYPGSTVDYSVGQIASRWRADQKSPIQAMDTPGTYSLFPKSTDEEVTLKALFEHPKYGAAQLVVVVIDATQLDRNLLLVQQIKESGFQFIVALTMTDLLKKNKIELSTEVLEAEFGAPFIKIDGVLGAGVQQLVERIQTSKATQNAKLLQKWSPQQNEKYQKHFSELKNKALNKSVESIYARTLKVDQFLLHPVFGIVLFLAVMTLLFSSIFYMATPFMDFIDGQLSSVADFILENGQGSLISDFFAKGIVGGVGSVVIFVPQIFILFFGLGLLESSGYLARAATLIDKPFSKIGLSGRSFVPILSGFACAVPALMATRNISSKRDRWMTNFIIPLMTCSARLPVYALLLTFLFKDEAPWKAGLALAFLYILALIVGAIAAGILHKILERNQVSLFMMELPLYRFPKLKVIAKQTLNRTVSYLTRAGPAIFVLSVLIWFGTTFPNYQAETDQIKLETSYAAQLGQIIEPVITPMGGDWRVGIGLISAFAAREVFVSTLALVMNITDEDEEGMQNSLIESMKNATHNGYPLFTVASVSGLLIFFMIALQCMTTVAVARREMGGWKPALIQLVSFNITAYLLAVIVVQSLRAIGIA